MFLEITIRRTNIIGIPIKTKKKPNKAYLPLLGTAYSQNHPTPKAIASHPTIAKKLETPLINSSV
jgi:hypothetical protein